MGTESSDIRFQIAKLELKAGDILVVKIHLRQSEISAQTVQEMMASLKHYVGIDCRVLVIDEHMELSVVTKAEEGG